jgi:hypothetical protein
MKRRTTRALLVLVSFGLLFGVASAGGVQGAPAHDFTLGVAESSATVEQGHETQFHIAITRGNGFTAGVAVSVAGLPASSQGVFTPALDTSNARVLTVYTTALTQVGTFTLTFKGTSGALVHTTTTKLTVTAAPPTPGFLLDVSPSNQNVKAGTSTSYTVTITRRLFILPITFTVSGLPASTTASFSPSPTGGGSTTLTVTTTLSTPLGSNDLLITGTSGSFHATTTAHLTVSAGQGKQFAISGSLDRSLAPGVTGFLDLALTNPNNQPMDITNLTVSITGTSKAGCATSNFSVTQFSGTYPVTLPANSTKTLSQLGVAQPFRPQVTMIDLPVNQDVCKNTGLTLGYTGTGQGN